MKRYSIFLAEEAENDLLDIYTYIACHDSVNKAEAVLSRLENTYAALSSFPQRGHIVKELKSCGVQIYRELSLNPYRIIYEVLDHHVRVHAILDGRRNLQDHLQFRFLGA